MVRKGNQHKNVSIEKEKSKVHNQNTVDSGERVSSGNSKRIKNKQRQQHVPCKEKAVGTPEPQQTVESLSNVQNASGDDILFEDTERKQNDGVLFESNHNPNLNMSEGLTIETMTGYIRSSVTVAYQKLSVFTLDVLSAVNGWLEQQNPRVSIFKAYACNGRDYILVQIKHVYPIIWTWVKHFGQLILLLFVVWLDCNIRGISSLLCLGTTSFFTVVWCSILSIVSMVGFTKVLIVMIVSAVVGLFVGWALGILILVLIAVIGLWLYGNFWTTLLITFIGGSSFAMGHERVALLVTTIYSMYCAKSYVRWLGLLLGLNLSFISSDILTYFLKNSVNEQGSYNSSEHDRQTPSGAGHFYSEPSHSSPVDDSSASRSSSVPSTSSCDAELTSEGEVLRLLNCNDHYSAFGITRFENIDIPLLKREYRKKAMLVHPDKNMGNEKAAEAFKKLQNAYEVLLDTLKRKTYDDELRREELLNYFWRFQSASRKNGKHNIFSSGSTHFEADDEGNPEESRRIACKNCGNFHKWTHTGRSKSQARWCQDCNDFHQAKDGDGWLEQSAHPFLFGLLQKMDSPCAYVCAEGRIYNATEWFICQGMRCAANTHRASFHVNTSLSSKHNSSSNTKGARSSQRGSKPMPNANIDESMTEEEFFDWLQNAMQSGIFEASGGGSTSESPTAKNGGSPKGSSSVTKKRKGKKQW